MTLTLVHSFVSAKAQSADATLVSKNEWNAAHTFTMATGALLGRTTASAGAVEEITPNTTDFTLSAGALALGAPDIFRVLTADISLADLATAQTLFTAGSFTAAGSTTYAFDANYWISRSAGTTSHTTGVLFGGTATFTSLAYVAEVANPTGNVLSSPQLIMSSAASLLTLTAANTSATENLMIRLNGVMRINGTGTVIPQIQFSAAPGGTPTFKANSYFRMRKLGTDTVAIGGSWA